MTTTTTRPAPSSAAAEPSADVLARRAAATRRRVGALEHDEHHRNSFMPYHPEPLSPYVRLGGERLLMMSGYSYLGLNGDPRIAERAAEAVRTYGSGAHGVRALAGSLPLHDELEQQVARTAGREAALVFSSGYAVNLGVIGALVGEGDTVVVDKLAHASILDGCRLSGADVVRFRHNDAEHLAARLAAAPATGVRLVVVDSVYSMDGDIAPLPALREVCDAHGALLMVDEAHALGTVGRTGRGIEEHFEHRHLADVKVGTLSKGIPSVGGWVAASADLVHHLRYAARPFLFSAALPAAQAAAALESLRILEAEPWRAEHVQRESRHFRELVRAGGMDVGDSRTAVVPLVIGTDLQAYEYATACRDGRVVGLPVVTPAVPTNTARLRIAITAAHTREHVEHAADVFLRTAARTGLGRR